MRDTVCDPFSARCCVHSAVSPLNAGSSRLPPSQENSRIVSALEEECGAGWESNNYAGQEITVAGESRIEETRHNATLRNFCCLYKMSKRLF